MKANEKHAPNQRLRDERFRRGWSQQELADQLGTTAGNVSRWERGITAPGPFLRDQLCALLGRNAAELGFLPPLPHEMQPLAVQPGLVNRPDTSVFPTVPPVWNVPFRRTPFFTGREEVLMRLHQAFLPGQTATLAQAICGLGGIGKTQVAIEYAYRSQDRYQAVLWAKADTSEVLLADIAGLCKVLGLSEQDEQDQHRMIEAVKRWLAEQTDWLLILDNVEDLSAVSEVLPLAPRGHILLTTRTQVTGTLARWIELEQLEREEGALLLLRRAKRIASHAPFDEVGAAEQAMALQIAEDLGALPLALDQAGAYIEETACSLSAYHTLYQNRRASLLRLRGEGVTDHPTSVTATLSLCIEKVAQTSAAALDLLRLCAFLHPDALPETIITAGASELGPVLGPVAADPLAFDSTLKELRKYSLLRRSPETRDLSIHRLVQAIVKDSMPEDLQREWAGRTIRAMGRVLAGQDLASWTQWERYFPHAQSCITLIEQWHLSFLEAAEVLSQIANGFEEHAQYSQAESLYQYALTLQERVLGPDHPAVGRLLIALAGVFHVQARYNLAEPLYQRALTLGERTLGPDHPDVADSLNELALLFTTQGRYAEAEPLYGRTLAIREQQLGPDHPAVAESLNNLALLYHTQGRYQQAEPLFQRALALVERELGPEHLYVSHALHNLAKLSLQRGQYAQAKLLFQRSLAIREKVQGTEHYRVAQSLNYLAELYAIQGSVDQAEALCQRALTIRTRTFGSDHPLVAESLTTLARIFCMQHAYAQAEALFHRALTIHEETQGSSHPEAAEVLSGLATLALAQKNYESTALYAHQAITIYQQSLGPEHPSLAPCLHCLAQIAAGEGHNEQAASLYQQALAICSRMLGSDHPETVRLLKSYASFQGSKTQKDAVAQATASPIEAKSLHELPLVPGTRVVKAGNAALEKNSLATFFALRCVFHPLAWSKAGDLWDAYQAWVHIQGEHFPLTRHLFTEHLKAKGCTAARTNTSRIWRGIALRDPGSGDT